MKQKAMPAGRQGFTQPYFLRSDTGGKTQPAKKSGAGFTIVELLVAFTIFLIVVVGGAFNLLNSSITAQRIALANQEVINQASSVSEYMSRAIRQAQKDTAGTCITAGSNYEITGRNGVQFINRSGTCTEFYLDSTVVKEETGSIVDLTANDVQVLAFRISVTGETQSDNLQPRVTFLLDIQTADTSLSTQPRLQFQTTITQRSIDVEN